MKKSNQNESRRNFIKTVLPVGTMACFGCPSILSASAVEDKEQELEFGDKIQTEFSISYEALYKSRYRYYIQRMEKFAEYMGREELIGMLKRAVDDINRDKKPNLEAISVKDFVSPILESEYFKYRLDLKVLELSDEVCQMKITNCLWAKTFRDMNAGDIGYANTCHGDFSGATAFNPKLRMERTKTLMEGHDCCNHRYIWNGEKSKI
jgi:hypothetical protein